jgi:menaquinone-dependent protoporphyrinogen oxidase
VTFTSDADTRTDEAPSAAEADQPSTQLLDRQARILVVYATRHGSTAEVAETVAAEVRAAGAQADVRPAAAGAEPAGYDAVVVAAPMIMGWHKAALRYVRGHRARLAGLPTAYLVTAMSLTDTGDDEVSGVPIVKDPWLAKPPRNAAKLSYRERYAAPAHYLGDILRKTAPVHPRTVGFFAGSLDFTTMNLLEKLFVLLVVGATPGDARNWDAIRAWAHDLLPQLTGADQQE